MPWVNELSKPKELKRCIRDLVALSTLPALWRDYGPRQIADSVAAALLSMINADVVYVAVSDNGDERAVGVIRTRRTITLAAHSDAERIMCEASAGRREQISVIDNFLEDGALHVTSVPIGFDGNSLIAAGSANPRFPNETHRLLMGIAASDVTIALQRWYADAERRRLVMLIEQSSEFVGFASRDGKPRYINAAGRALVGLSGTDLSDLTVFDFIAPHDQARARHEVLPVVQSAGRWLGELDFRHFKTGEVIPFSVDWFQIGDGRTGRPTNMATVSRDLRPQKKLESELQHFNETLEHRVALRTVELVDALQQLRTEASEHARADTRANQLQLELLHSSRLSAAGQMAAALAHELSQPLTALTNSINASRRILGKDARNRTDTVREILDEAVDQAGRAGEIIRRLRDFVIRGETDKRIEILSTLIREASDLAAAGAGVEGVHIRLHFDPAAKAVFGSRIQLQQVMVNLIRNAYEAMAQSERRQLHVCTARRNNEIEITITDTGRGLPDDMVENLFEPFQTTKSTGMGLGLTICRSIVEDHGGQLVYQPNQGGGAIFLVKLPVIFDRLNEC